MKRNVLYAPALASVIAAYPVAAHFMNTPERMVREAEKSIVRVEMSEGSGSGFLLDKQGYIMTCAHVAHDPDSKVSIEFSDGTTAPARIVGALRDIDVALLKVDEKSVARLTPLQFATAKIRVGDPVTEIGNPFNVGLTVTTGIVSALNRDPGVSKAHTIQFSAPTNPGNSGGAVLNDNGRVIGMAEAILTNRNPFGGGQQNSGISFAIPASYLKIAYDYIKLVDSTYSAPAAPVENGSFSRPFFRNQKNPGPT